MTKKTENNLNLDDLDNHSQSHTNELYEHWDLIDGKKVTSKQVVEIINPDGFSVIGTVPALSTLEINEAYAAARRAQKNWEAVTLLKRIEILKKWRNLIAEHETELATIMMKEIAKGYKEALNEVRRTVEYIDYTFEEAKRLQPSAFTGEEFGISNKLGIFERVAKGVGLAISPFNYPLNLAISKIMPALVMGNTLVFKPATAGSLVGTKLGELALSAQLPAGIFNVVTGRGREIGDILVKNQEINFISFTGSVDVGINLLETAITKDVVLELGGKDPALVLDDLQLDKYAKQIVAGAYGYSGQRCTAIKRVLTTDPIADRLIPHLIKEIDKLAVGSPKENAAITPVIDQKAANYVLKLMDDAVADGAKVLVGGQHRANLIWPTLVDHVTPKMALAWEEPFGPVLPIIRLKNRDEMIAVANASKFGLQASVFSQEITPALIVAKELEVGTVNINGKSQRGPDSFPFLGVKDSGFGVQGIRETLLSVTRVKGLVINY
ncbi:glyceraldehyde-3-phosphate dehydrogenase (NADP+) [Entomoplasma freundtii]|uniref:Glyceraldehyde-3-phosphate dehydrogenase n=1 Tax=Entomoplasma freundtii TaxID=74700 RepID=A0A2K8NRZ2_9MOLU|nr:NADP-dependent glyceraldehyde-3-phosphate dehydrogenase [Entomoplasma freundtii]ATZ16524.1 glyceraldehyde-3-phosphate dehydrogenase [Entomoplasma freundtii]TDY58310.1 glyceraldehyde-3-phosphate dehydrogenase (NADP+) [Entomoplasma freundtii]